MAFLQLSWLQSFGLMNFKSYDHAVLSFHPLTLMVGANASGKSNLLEALRLASWLADGHRFDQFSRARHEDDVAFRGRFSDFTRRGHHEFQLYVTFTSAAFTGEISFPEPFSFSATISTLKGEPCREALREHPTHRQAA